MLNVGTSGAKESRGNGDQGWEEKRSKTYGNIYTSWNRWGEVNTEWSLSSFGHWTYRWQRWGGTDAQKYSVVVMLKSRRPWERPAEAVGKGETPFSLGNFRPAGFLLTPLFPCAEPSPWCGNRVKGHSSTVPGGFAPSQAPTFPFPPLPSQS